MWRIEEHRQVDKELSSGHVPAEILKRYEKWKDIATLSGPHGLRVIKGEWKGFRSSRLNERWRVIYRVAADALLVQVIRGDVPRL